MGTAVTITAIATSIVLRKTAVNGWIAEFPIPNNIFLPGDPTAITQSANSNNTRLATTAFVRQELTAATRPAVEATRSTTQAITVGASTTIIFNTVQLDTSAAYNATTGVFTVPVGQAGMYEYSMYVGFSPQGNNIQIYPVKNGIAQDNLRNPGLVMATDGIYYVSSTLKIRLTVGDTLRFDVFYNSVSGAIANTSTINFPSLCLYRIYS